MCLKQGGVINFGTWCSLSVAVLTVAALSAMHFALMALPVDVYKGHAGRLDKMLDKML